MELWELLSLISLTDCFAAYSKRYRLPFLMMRSYSITQNRTQENFSTNLWIRRRSMNPKPPFITGDNLWICAFGQSVWSLFGCFLDLGTASHSGMMGALMFRLRVSRQQQLNTLKIHCDMTNIATSLVVFVWVPQMCNHFIEVPLVIQGNCTIYKSR